VKPARRTDVVREGLFVVVMAAFLTLPAVACTMSLNAGTGASPGATGTDLGLVPNGSVTAVVLSTVDGDTIHVRVDGREDKVRFIGVDTPEVDWYGHPGECYGAAAGTYTRHRLDGATVRLDFDVRLRDRYGRLLAYVYLGDELFNRTLVERGYATNDPVPPDTRMEDVLASAENDARGAGRGLWSSCPAT
jgi:micrococcal nuclease